MGLNDDEDSGREGLQQGEETMCQAAGGESGLSSGSFTFIETLYLAEKSWSHHQQYPLGATPRAVQ